MTTQISTVDISNDVKNLSNQVVDLENQLSQGKLLLAYFGSNLWIIDMS